jgi:hypothetical protein
MTTFDGVVVDYGHGEDTPGKRYKFTDHGGLECREYMTNRMTAAHLIRLLVLLAGVPVYDCVAGRMWEAKDVQEAGWCWHRLEPRDTPLSTRVRRANERPSWLVVSLHSNAVGMVNEGPSLPARGGVIYTSRGQTSSDEVATAVHKAFVEAFEDEPVSMRHGDWSDGDPDEEADFYMVRKTRGACILGEMLYFVNVDDARYLLSEWGQQTIAWAYYEGLLPFLVSS